MAAATGIPEKENRIEKQPEIKLQQVIVFGICCFKPILSYRFQSTNLIPMPQSYQIDARHQLLGQLAHRKAS